MSNKNVRTRIGYGASRLFIVAFLLALSTITTAQKSNKSITEEMLAGRVDLAVPETPAFTVLGVTPEKVMRPTTSKVLAIGLLSGLDYRGNAQTGLAVDTRPWFLIKGDEFTLSQYRDDPVQRQLSRLRLSFATAAGQSDADKADRYALGLTWTPWDRGDHRMDSELNECYKKYLALSSERPPVILPTNGRSQEEAEQLNREAMKKRDKELAVKAKNCVRDAQKRNWNASAWDLGIAGYTVNGKDEQESGYAAWTSIAIGIYSWGQLIAHGRVQNNELVPDAARTTGYRTQDSWIAGVRLRVGSDRGSLMLEGSYSDIDPDNKKRFSNSYAAIGTEFKLMKGLWLQLSVADTYGDNPDDDGAIVSGQLRWGVSETRLLGLP